MDCIFSMPIPSTPKQDQIIWPFTNNGCFTTASTSIFLHSLFYASSNTSDFNWLQKHLRSTPRIKFLLWLTFHNHINTKNLIFHKHIIPFPLYHFCSQNESVIHVLRDCQNAKHLWLSLGYNHINSTNFFTEPSLTTWLKHNCSKNKVFPAHWNTIFSYTCQTI